MGLSDPVAIALIAGSVTVCTAAVTALLSYRIAILSKKADVAAAIGTATHTLVNGNTSGQLRLTAMLARRVAILSQDKSDFEAADLADDLLKEHLAASEQAKKEQEAMLPPA